MKKSVSEIQIPEQHFSKIMTRNNKEVETTETTKRTKEFNNWSMRITVPSNSKQTMKDLQDRY